MVAAANRHDSPLLRPTLEKLNRFAELPEKITLHLDAGYDSTVTRELLDEFGRQGQIAHKGEPAPLQATRRWPVERTNSRHNRGFKKLAICTHPDPSPPQASYGKTYPQEVLVRGAIASSNVGGS